MMPGMAGTCPTCGRMMGSPQLQDPEAIRRQIQMLQKQLEEIETVQHLKERVQYLEERLRKLEEGDSAV